MSAAANHKSRAEQLTEQFYHWERAGRGWTVWPYPVDLEPPFEPFFFHRAEQQVTDDGRHETFFSSIRDRLLGRAEPRIGPTPSSDQVESEAYPAQDFGQFVEIHSSLPLEQKVMSESMSRLLETLVYLDAPVAFEVIGQADSITIQLACAEIISAQLQLQLVAHFPEAVLRKSEGFLEGIWKKSNSQSFVADFGLSREFMFPLRIVQKFDVDPLIGITAALSELSHGEVGAFQVLFQSVRNPWPESIMRSVSDGSGGSFFVDMPQLIPAAKEKISRPIVAAVVRIGATSPRDGRARQIAQSVASALNQFREPTGNELVPLTNDDYPDAEHEVAFLGRYSYRCGMLLNLDELISFVHLPSASVREEKLERYVLKTKAAPGSASQNGIVLGHNVHREKTTTVSLNTEQRLRHTYVVGASGTGKSTLLLNMILQDIEHGNGIAVLDPHGDLIDRILGHIPENRAGDVVLIDPSDEEFPVGFNILSAHSEIEKTLLASDLVSVFRRLSTTWGDQMTSVLGNAILAFLESNRGGTLADLRRFLVEAEYREDFLKTVGDPDIVYYWKQEFPLLAGRPQAPLLTRLDTFLRPKLIRYMVGQKKDRLDFRSMMDCKKIVLAKLAQGAIGEENAYLLGTLIVAKLHQMALGRQNIPEADRDPFYVYIDEFHNFITPSIAAILSGARKFGLGLILSHQELSQISNQDTAVASAAISNPATRVCFRLGDADAAKLQAGFSSFDSKDLQSLGIGQAIARVERSEYDFNLKTMPLPEIDAGVARTARERVVRLSRERYARRRIDVAGTLSKTRTAIVTGQAKESKGKQSGVTVAAGMNGDSNGNGNGHGDVHRQPKPGSAVSDADSNGNKPNGKH